MSTPRKRGSTDVMSSPRKRGSTDVMSSPRKRGSTDVMSTPRKRGSTDVMSSPRKRGSTWAPAFAGATKFRGWAPAFAGATKFRGWAPAFAGATAVRVAALAATLLLSSCSVTRIAYNNADVYLRWQANHYFDFQSEQSEELDRSVAAFAAWHRATALPQYARLGEEAAARMLRGVRREDLDWSYDAVRAQIREALGTAARDAAGLLDQLSPEQISHFERRLAEENRKFAKEQVQGTMEERHKRRVERNLERLEEWFGALGEAQAARVRLYSTRAPFSGEMRDRDRKRRQAEFVAMLRARETARRLAPWAQDWEAGREPAYVEASRATHTEYVELLLDLDRTLSAEQREHAAARLKRYGTLFDSLARQP